MAFKFLGQRQLGKLPSRWVSTILMVAIEASGVTKTVLEMITDLSIEAIAKATTKDEIYVVFQKYGVAFKEGR